MLILNFKTYKETTGTNAFKILESLEKLNSDLPDIATKYTCALSSIDLAAARERFKKINIMAQHVDPIEQGKFNGWISPGNVLGYGITFSLYNHSEHRMWGPKIKDEISFIQSLGINLVVCCESIEEAKQLLEIKPFGIAYETKELIGTGVSVTTNPDVIKEFIDLTKGKTMPFVGAGVTNREDVETSIRLGAEGVLLSSAFAKATNHYEFTKDLAQPFLTA